MLAGVYWHSMDGKGKSLSLGAPVGHPSFEILAGCIEWSGAYPAQSAMVRLLLHRKESTLVSFGNCGRGVLNFELRVDVFYVFGNGMRGNIEFFGYFLLG